MSSSAFALGFEQQEGKRREREVEKRDEREARLQTLLNSGLPPAQVQQGIRDIYGQDAPALQRHVENLFRRVAGKRPVQAQAPRRAADLAQLESQGKSQLEQQKELLDYRQSAAAPKFGSFDIPGASLAAGGITTDALGAPIDPKQTYRERDVGGRTGYVPSTAKASNARPVPYYAGAMNIATAKSMQSQGMEFKGADGQPYDLDTLPAGSFLYPIFSAGGGSYWGVGTDKGRYESAGNQRLYEPSVGAPNPQAPSIGPVRTPTSRSSTTVDPFGVSSTTTSTTTPQTTPAPAVGAQPPAVAPAAPVAPTASPTPTPSIKRGASAPRKSTPAAPSIAQLDASGHIPAGVANPQLTTAANQLLDGMDISKLKLPQRDAQAAAQLASQYGWNQGGFTPRELSLVQESRSLIQQIKKDPAAFDSVYSAGPIKRGVIAHLIKASGSSFTGDILRAAASSGLSDNDIKFIQTYRQLIGRIQGIAQLTRGSGRPAEAAIQRMIGELPDPTIITSPEAAERSFDLIENEIDTALSAVKQPAPKAKNADASDTTVDDFINKHINAPTK